MTSTPSRHRVQRGRVQRGLPAPTSSPKPSLRIQFDTFYRGLTLDSPAWLQHMERAVKAGDRWAIKLLEPHLSVLPQSLREAVLVARVRS